MASEARTVRGTIEFIWDSGGHMLVTMDPEHPDAPHALELTGALRERLAGELSEGDRVEVELVAVEHEVVDPDAGPSDSLRHQVRELRLLGR